MDFKKVKVVLGFIPLLFLGQVGLSQEVWRLEVPLKQGRNVIETERFTAFTIQYSKDFGDSVIKDKSGN